MDQPLDFSKMKKSSQSQSQMNSMPKLFHHQLNSENEESGRSSSSPSSTATDRSTPEIFANSLSAFSKLENNNQNLLSVPSLMLASPNVFANLSVLNNPNVMANRLNLTGDALGTLGTLGALNNFMLNNKINPFNQTNFQQQDVKPDPSNCSIKSNENLNKSNKSISRPKAKAISRKSTIMAKHQQDEPMQSTSKFDPYSPTESLSSPEQSTFNQFGLQDSMNSMNSLSNSQTNSSVTDESPVSVKRRRSQPISEESKDQQYWMRRFKNNEAAKKSRDLKRLKDLETARRACELEAENLVITQQLTQLKKENSILRNILSDFFAKDANQLNQITENVKASDDSLYFLAEEFKKFQSKNENMDANDNLN